jgi:hypothetical protein
VWSVWSVTWHPCERDDVAFLDSLHRIVQVLTVDEPPEASRSCTFCSYRER